MEMYDYVNEQKNNGAIYIDEKSIEEILSLIFKKKESDVEIIFFDFLKLKEILPLLPKNKNIVINNIGKSYTIEQLSTLSKYNNIWLYDNDKEKINKILKQQRYLALKVIVKPEMLIQREEFYSRLINFIKANNFSPLEAICYIYSEVIYNFIPNGSYNKDFKNYVKKYPGVNSKTSDWNICKNSALILTDQYIHCEGYTNIIDEIVQKLNMPSLKHEQISTTEGGGHAINKVIINDSKYEISGCYFCDPLKDSDFIKRADKKALTSLAMFMMNFEEFMKNPYIKFIPNGINDFEKQSKKIDFEILSTLISFIYHNKGNFDMKKIQVNIDSIEMWYQCICKDSRKSSTFINGGNIL